MKHRANRGNVARSFKSLVSTQLAIRHCQAPPFSKTLWATRVCLFMLLFLICGFLASSAQAQDCSDSVIFADDFESDPSPRWTISRESTDPSTFVPRNWTWVHTLPDGRTGSAFFAPQ
jgi:hypothetical protein